jgi:hypothetical protein
MNTHLRPKKWVIYPLNSQGNPMADGPTMLIQYPGLTRPELKAFKKGFKLYSFTESTTPVPVPLWVFEWPKPFGAIDVGFNARLVGSDYIENFLDTAGGVKNRLIIHLLDGLILRVNKMVGLDPAAVELFHETIKKQLATDYSDFEYAKYLGPCTNILGRNS